MAGVEGFEPPTLGLEIRCSIRLSYTPLIPTGYYHTATYCTRKPNHRRLEGLDTDLAAMPFLGIEMLLPDSKPASVRSRLRRIADCGGDLGCIFRR